MSAANQQGKCHPAAALMMKMKKMLSEELSESKFRVFYVKMVLLLPRRDCIVALH